MPPRSNSARPVRRNPSFRLASPRSDAERIADLEQENRILRRMLEEDLRVLRRLFGEIRPVDE